MHTVDFMTYSALPKTKRERIVKVARAVLVLTSGSGQADEMISKLVSAAYAAEQRRKENIRYFKRARGTDETSHYRSA